MKQFKTILNLAILMLTIAVVNAQQGMVAHWSFDTIVDDQFNDHVTERTAGTIYGCETVPGPVGNALGLDGIDDYARVPGGIKPPPAVFHDLSKGSISLWFRVEDIPMSNGIRPIFYYGRQDPCDFFDAANEGMIIEVGHSPIHNGSRRLYFTEWTNGCTFPSFCYDSWNPITEGIWYHYVAVVGEDYNTGYLNGQEMTDRRYNFGNASTHEFFADALAHENLWIGRGYWDSNNMYFKGAIDEIKIFNRPLTQAEIDTLYWEGNPFTTVIQHGDQINRIRVYPNPAVGNIHVEIANPNYNLLTIKIFNTVGEIVILSFVEEVLYSIPVQTNELSEGVYVYSIVADGKELKTDKLIIR